MRMRIDETRGHDFTLGVDFLFAAPGHRADGDDFPGFDSDIGLERRATGTVDHRAAADDKIHHGQNPNLSAIRYPAAMSPNRFQVASSIGTPFLRRSCSFRYSTSPG